MKQKHYSYNFHPMSKLHEHIGYHGGIQGITFLGNQPNFKIWWYFEILTTWEVNWKNHKMCNILKTAGHGAKQMLGGGGEGNSMCGGSFEFSFRSTTALCKKFLMLTCSKGCWSPIFHPILTKPYSITFSGI